MLGPRPGLVLLAMGNAQYLKSGFASCCGLQFKVLVQHFFPLEELLELDLDLDLAGDLLWDLDRDTDRDLLLSLRPEPDLDTERDLDLLRSSSSVSAIDCLID